MQERLKLDLSQKTSVSQGITTRVNDGGIHSIDVTALNYGDVFDLTGYKITFELTTSAKTIAFDSVNSNITDPKNGEFTYTIPKEITGVAGIAERAYFSFVKEGKRITSADVDMTILQLVDITAEEARSYIAEYNKLVEDLNQAYKDAIDQMSKDYEVVQEKINGIMAELSALKLQIEAYQKSVEKTANEAIYKISTATNEALTAVADAIAKLESANAIDKADLQNYLTGGKLSADHTSDLKNKVPGSDVENPHFIGKRQNLTTSNLPSGNWTELDPYEIRSVSALDNNLYTVRSENKDEIVQVVIKWDLIKDIERRQPGVFDLYGATTPEQKVAVTRQLITNLIPSLYGYGSGTSGNKLTLSVYDGEAWVGSTSNNTGTIKKITYTDWNKPSSINRFIDDNGFVNLIAYAPASDGVTLSVVNIDYVSLDYTLETSMIDMYAAKSDFEAHKNDEENPHSTTAAQVKAVALTGNEDISGVKNFETGILIDGQQVQVGLLKRAITDADRSDVNNITNVNGMITRIGNFVFIAFNFTCTNWASGVETRWVIKVPTGYGRDTGSPAQIPLALTRNANQAADARAILDQSNIIQVKSGNGSSYISGMWVTNDEWPN